MSRRGVEHSVIADKCAPYKLWWTALTEDAAQWCAHLLYKLGWCVGFVGIISAPETPELLQAVAVR